ncbi:LysR family transcriptional regulator [Emcibacter nanhaiensis]|uniref:LysR family transcriptional regulator n=1 Tax=Emcibacter nanhaiensis TaxID=1505037 RepID=A0A501PKR6_9PROT|nr:LysR family transcriptional regulator [Emcibacter nanhaiensis]TPD60682.1 LysR family transcriptional regulator [Emcibacter nanhaiensis]
MIRLGLHHIAMIKSLGMTGNVSATARELGLGQSAVSHRMKEAERRAGASLFRREGHSIALTQAGRRLLGAAANILSELESAEKDIEQLCRGVDTIIRIGAACYAGFGWFPGFLKSLEARHPNCTAEIVAETSEDPAALLATNSADMVLTATPVERPDIKCLKLTDDRLVAVMASGHPLTHNNVADPRDIINYTYVTHHTYPEKGREYETIFRPLNLLPKRVISAGRTQALTEILLTGEAVTILPELAIGNQARRLGLRLLPILSDPKPVAWYALFKPKSRNASMEEELMRLLQESIRK